MNLKHKGKMLLKFINTSQVIGYDEIKGPFLLKYILKKYVYS